MVEILTNADIANERIWHFKDVWQDPQALENKYVVPMENFDGTTTLQSATPIRFSEEEPKSIEDIHPTVVRSGPKIGMDSEEILKEYGYSEEEIRNFEEQNVIRIER